VANEVGGGTREWSANVQQAEMQKMNEQHNENNPQVE